MQTQRASMARNIIQNVNNGDNIQRSSSYSLGTVLGYDGSDTMLVNNQKSHDSSNTSVKSHADGKVSFFAWVYERNAVIFFRIFLFFSVFTAVAMLPLIAVGSALSLKLPAGFEFLMPFSKAIGNMLSNLPPDMMALAQTILLVFVIMLCLSLTTHLCVSPKEWKKRINGLFLGLRFPDRIGESCEMQIKFVQDYERGSSYFLTPFDANTVLGLGDRNTFAVDNEQESNEINSVSINQP